MKVRQGLTYDDLLLVPQHSTIESRSLVDTSVDLGKGVKLDIPVVSANMTNVTEMEMAQVIAKLGGMPIFHRFCDKYTAADMLSLCQQREAHRPQNFASSVGVSEKDKNRAEILVSYGAKILCVDVAHGDHVNALRMVSYITQTYPYA